MKKILLFLAITITLASIIVPIVVSSPTAEPALLRSEVAPDKRKMEERHQKRIAKRKARQEAFEKMMDSTILSHNYRFVPTMFNVEPAGSSHLITNPSVELAVHSDWVDVHLPIYQGFTPPYDIMIVNSAVTNLSNFITEQTNNGWTISFSSWLYTANDYDFVLEVFSKTGGATLTISSSFDPTTTYWGSISPIY